MSEEKSIYDLGLNEILNLSDSRVMRVPGGWIYGLGSGLIFVPFNNEFQVPDISVPIDTEAYEPPRVVEAKR
jgi:hypothetical protein